MYKGNVMKNFKDYYRGMLAESPEDTGPLSREEQFPRTPDIHDNSDKIVNHIRRLHDARVNNDEKEIKRFSGLLTKFGIDPEKIKTPEGWSYSHPEQLGNFSFERIQEFKLDK